MFVQLNVLAALLILIVGLMTLAGFAKRGFPHTSNLPTLMIRNFRLVIPIYLKLVQHEAPT